MTAKPLSPHEQEMIDALAAMKDEDIDTIDIPALPPEKLALAMTEAEFRARKRPVTLNLDSDIISWFKENSGTDQYQAEINRVLRRHVTDAVRQKR